MNVVSLIEWHCENYREFGPWHLVGVLPIPGMKAIQEPSEELEFEASMPVVATQAETITKAIVAKFFNLRREINLMHAAVNE